MSEKETNRRPEASTEDKMQELFRLMDEKAAQGTLVETEEDAATILWAAFSDLTI